MAVTYDNDADEVHAPGSHDSLGVHPERAEAEVADLEKKYRDTSAPERSTSSAADSSELKEGEEAPDRSGFSAADDINEKLGRGYTGKGSTKSKGLAKLYGSNSKLKKKIAIAGAASGGSAILGILVFFAMLPLKIEHIIQNLESKYTATSQSAVSKEVDNLFAGYIKSSVIPALKSGKCYKTVEPSCHVVPAGTGPVASLYAAWGKIRLENKLANKFGIILGKSRDGKFFVNVNGKSIGTSGQLRELQDGKISLFDLDGTKEFSRNDVRKVVRAALKEGTLWDRSYGRFIVGRYLEKNFGIKRCVIACDIKDKFTDKIADKKLAAKAYLIQRLVPDKYSAIMACITQPDTCDQTLGDAQPEEGERRTEGQKSIADILENARGHFTDEGLSKLVSFANDAAKDGLTKTIVSKAMAKLVTTVAGEDAGKVAAAGASKAIPIIGWVLFAAQIHQIGDSLGTTIKWMNYSANAASAVELYSAYNTVASEAKSGHMDATELGSFTDALSTNLTGTKTDQADATSTPLYANLFNETKGTTASMFGSLFGTASADATTNAGTYKCDDGSGVPKGKLVCPEERLAQENSVANGIQSVLSSVDGIPGVGTFFDAVNKINDAIGSAFSAAFSTACDAADGVGSVVTLGQVQPCSDVTHAVSGLFGDLFSWIGKKLIISPFSNSMSGGRSFDMIAAGSDAANNASCRANLGCTQVSNSQVASVQNQVLADQKAAFNSQSLFSRMFSTDSSYSLVSQLAMDMPTNTLTATDGSVTSVLSNPLGKFGSMFASVFSGNHAFAASAPQDDPFGVVQYGYPDSSIPSDPQGYWDQHCENGDMAKYDETTKKLDISSWLNNSNNVIQDPDTGEQFNKNVNPCLLIQSTVQAAGATSDPSLLPTDTLNSSTTATTSAGTYQNPVIKSNAPDPAIVQDGDGTYYLYATGCPSFQKFKSTDLVNWTSAGNGLSNPPGWLNGNCWAPDVTKVGSSYVMTFSGGTCSSGMKIGYATASTAAGPFNYQGILVDDQGSGCGYDIDPDLEDMNGQLILYYGSGRNYISARTVTTSGNHLTAGAQHRIDVGAMAEGSWVIKRGNYYYLFYSTGSYRDASYAVHVARSTSPMSGFQNDPNAVLTTGNGFSGPGHNTIITDGAGTDWIAYICYKSNDVGGTRNVCLDKVTYTNGWPTVNDGHPSNSTMPAPGTGGVTGTNGKLVVGEYNILNDPKYSHDAGMKYGTDDDRVALEAKIVRGTAGPQHAPFDVLITNEENPTMYKAQKKYLTEYSSVENSEYAIFWNSSRFSLVTQGTSTQWGGGGNWVDAPWVKLRTADGQTITLTAVHYSSFPQYNYSDANIKKAANYTLDWVKQQNDGKSIVIFGGDLGEHKNIPATMFNGSGLIGNSKFMAEGKTATGSQSAPGGADQIYITPLSGLTASDWHNPPRTGIIMQSSDHSPTWVTLNYKATK